MRLIKLASVEELFPNSAEETPRLFGTSGTEEEEIVAAVGEK